jgi:tetratricopeptide (TPR) repeat protein
MVLTTDLKTEDQDNYDRLIVALEASLGKLVLLLLVCDDRNLRATIIDRYERKLQAGGTQTFRFLLNCQDPSLRDGLAALVSQQPALQNGEPAIATVLGVDNLLTPMLAIPSLKQEIFLGYEQWARESLLNLQFPVVLWLNSQIMSNFAERTPDFWSWRTGVYWFGVDRQAQKIAQASVPQPQIVYRFGMDLPSPKIVEALAPQPQVVSWFGVDLPMSNIVAPSVTQPQIGAAQVSWAAPVPQELLDDLTQLIAILDQQAIPDSEVLVDLDSRLSELYDYAEDSVCNRDSAILFFQQVIKLLRKFNLKAELASNLKTLGNLYFEQKYDTQSALLYYDEALILYRDLEDRLGEANTLRAIGDVLQFLNQCQAALSRYDEALTLYRDIGNRQGEAHSLRAIGDVCYFLEQDQAALSRYDEALILYRDIENRHGEANTLLSIGIILQYRHRDQHQAALSRYNEALTLYRDLGDRLGEANSLQFIGEIFQYLGQHQVALSRYHEALMLHRDVGSRLGEANTLQSIGNCEPDLEKAMTIFQSALEIYENIGDKYSQARILTRSIVPTYLKQEQLELVKNALQNVYHLATEVDSAAGAKIASYQIEPKVMRKFIRQYILHQFRRAAQRLQAPFQSKK